MIGCRSVTIAIALLSGLTGCSRAESDLLAAVFTRDSAGVTIVEHGRVGLAALPHLRLDSAPLVRVGVTDGDEGYQFNRIIDATVRADGSIAVLDRSMTLRVFGSRHAGHLGHRARSLQLLRGAGRAGARGITARACAACDLARPSE